jgi:protein-tyrosine phosphatase
MPKVRRKLLFTFFLFLSGAAPFALLGEQALQEKHETKAHERQIKLEGQDNFRDLGGYETKDGRTVKWGVIYRTGQLNQLSDADISRLEALKIRTVVDLRGTSEAKTRGKDRLPERVRRVRFPIDMNRLLKAIKKKSAPGGSTAEGADSMIQATKSIILDRTNVYAALIRELAKPQNRPLVFHCAAGKDRTGVGAAIVLTLLGVPWETVREDYLLSNYYRKDGNERELKELRNDIAKKKEIPPEQVDMTSYEALYYVEPEYLDAAFKEVIKKYGSMESYLRKGLGISDMMIEKLRNELLE